MLILFIFIIPLPLLFLRSGGFISRQLIKDNLIYDYILVKEKDNTGYGSVLYTEKIINNKKEITELFIEKNEIDIFQHFLNIQKKYSFDSILLDINQISNNIIQVINDLSKLNKTIYVAVKNVEIPKDLIFIYRQLNTQNINLLQFNMSVQSGIQLIFKRILDLVASVVLLFVYLR